MRTSTHELPLGDMAKTFEQIAHFAHRGTRIESHTSVCVCVCAMDIQSKSKFATEMPISLFVSEQLCGIRV